jgi:gas vesicle protein
MPATIYSRTSFACSTIGPAAHTALKGGPAMMLLRDPLPEWIKSAVTTLIGAVIGFISGFLADALKTRRMERRKRERMRRALYVEITQHYHAIRILFDKLKGVESLLTSVDEVRTGLDEVKEAVKEAEEKVGGARLLELKRDVERRQVALEQLNTQVGEMLNPLRPTLARVCRLVSTDSYKYAKSNPDIFYERPEAWTIDACYFELQLMLGGIESEDLKATLKSARSFLSGIDEAIDSGLLDKELLKQVAAPLHAKMGTHAKAVG